MNNVLSSMCIYNITNKITYGSIYSTDWMDQWINRII